MKKRFYLPLLTALPALLSSCSSPQDNINNYRRTSYPTYEECMRANQYYVAQGMVNPCQRQTGSTYVHGPYMHWSGSTSRAIGYTSTGDLDRRAYTYDQKTGKGNSVSSRVRVTRGSFGSSGGSSSGSSFGKSKSKSSGGFGG